MKSTRKEREDPLKRAKSGRVKPGTLLRLQLLTFVFHFLPSNSVAFNAVGKPGDAYFSAERLRSKRYQDWRCGAQRGSGHQVLT